MWDNQAMIPQSAILSSAKKEFPPADVEGKVTPVQTALSDSVSETKDTAVRLKTFDDIH